MASPASAQQEYPGLKYLGFIEILAEKATKHVANVYTFAKESTGPLKPSVHGIEATVKIIIGPIYDKLGGKPHELLLFVEKKVDDVVGTIDCAFFHSVKEKSFHAYDVAQHVPELVKLLVGELQHGDIVETARTCYHAYEPVAQEWSYAAWNKFKQLPFALPALRLATSPTIFCAKQANHLLDTLKELHVPFVGVIPNIPVDKLEKCVKVHLG